MGDAGGRERGASGRAGEEEAVRLLEERWGFRVVDTNIRFGSRREGLPGEIDVVAWDGGTLCFVEVKSRRAGAGAAAEGVTPAKQRQIARLALAYAARHGLLSDDADPVPLRFDVVAVTLSPGSTDGGAPAVRSARLLRGAFLAPDGFDEQ